MGGDGKEGGTETVGGTVVGVDNEGFVTTTGSLEGIDSN